MYSGRNSSAHSPSCLKSLAIGSAPMHLVGQCLEFLMAHASGLRHLDTQGSTKAAAAAAAAGGV